MLAYILKRRSMALMERFLMSFSSFKFSRLISFIFYFITILMFSSSLRDVSSLNCTNTYNYSSLHFIKVYKYPFILFIRPSSKRKTYLSYTPTSLLTFFPSSFPLTYNHSSIFSYPTYSHLFTFEFISFPSTLRPSI